MFQSLLSFTDNRKPKTKNRKPSLLALLVLLAFVAAGVTGCSDTFSKVKKWAGGERGDDEEEAAPLEAQKETVMIDGKPYVRSKNPYWLTYPEQPEYIYVEKGREFVGMQQYLIDSWPRQ